MKERESKERKESDERQDREWREYEKTRKGKICKKEQLSQLQPFLSDLVGPL